MNLVEYSDLARQHLYVFPKFVSGYRIPRHSKYIANLVQSAIEEQDDPSKRHEKHKIFMISGPPRHGKQLADSTDILTTKGWKKHGDLKIGDYVFGLDGKSTKVIAVSEKTIANMEIEFINGSVIKCHENHEWLVFDRNHKSLNKYFIRETKHLTHKIKGRSRFLLPSREPLEFNEADLPLHPYFVGVWLGDGTSSDCKITYAKKDYAMINGIIECGYSISASWIHNITGVITTNFARHGITNILRKLNLLNNKHIPDMYKHCSKEQRLQLLAGLIDSDGHVCLKTGRIRISTGMKKLAKDIEELTFSLGWNPYIVKVKPCTSSSGIVGKIPVYQIGFQPDCEIPTKLKRKKTIKIKPANRRIGIKNVYYTDSPEPGHCIQVKNKNGLYLAGKKLIPTHNSELMCCHGIPWILGNRPKKKIILAAYAAKLAEKISNRARNIFETWGPTLWDSYPSKNLFTRSDWETSDGGGCKATGIEAGVSGYGADVLLIDDYHKDSLSAESKLQRDNVWEWWSTAAFERLHPGGIVIIYATRWNDDDLCGRLLKQQEELGDKCPYEIINIRMPALAEENDVLGRKLGEALWPWWKNQEMLEATQLSLGSYIWSALYQGNPTPRGGHLFKSKYFRYYTIDRMTSDFLCWRDNEVEPIKVKRKELIRHVYVDPALEVKTMNDPTGMLAWGYSRKHKIWLLLDRINDRIEHSQMHGKILSFARKNSCISIGIENEKIGKILVKQSAGKDEIGGTKIPFKEIPTGSIDKYARATPMANYIENERVFFPQNAHWLSDYETGLVLFPLAAHDEDIDCTAMAAHMESKLSVTQALAGK
ncbi:phage terminase large subunit [Candidatus Pacearchaeota archaeon]|nr:phage terminase large subunit [Candidatus Pacearchaeota archaeon]